MAGSLLILWDPDCGFCACMIAPLLKADRRSVLRTATIQGPQGDRHLGHMDMEQRLASWHTVDERGAVLSGGAALTEVLRRLPVARPLAALIARLPGMTQRAYAWVAAHRNLLSRPIPRAGKARARRVVAVRAVSPAGGET